ncbi:uncharacterized protein [Hoplias malabaricus]
MVLLTFNTLLLIVILILIGIFISAGRKDQSISSEPREELWHLHGNMFYLFWDAEGSCSDATQFCNDRDSEIAELTHENRDWILLRVKGKKLWMNTELIKDGNLKEMLYPCPQDPEESDSGHAGSVEGWVCATRPHRRWRGDGLNWPFYLGERERDFDWFDHKEDGSTPGTSLHTTVNTTDHPEVLTFIHHHSEKDDLFNHWLDYDFRYFDIPTLEEAETPVTDPPSPLLMDPETTASSAEPVPFLKTFPPLLVPLSVSLLRLIYI